MASFYTIALLSIKSGEAQTGKNFGAGFPVPEAHVGTGKETPMFAAWCALGLVAIGY
jgi:hypothetical protein